MSYRRIVMVAEFVAAVLNDEPVRRTSSLSVVREKPR